MNSAMPDQPSKMKWKDYSKELRKLQTELCHLQEWVRKEGLRVIIVFEGRDAAGKGGTIKAITRAREPSRFPGSRPSGPLGSRKDPALHAALY